jgi:NAD(P)H-hydrate epimerase
MRTADRGEGAILVLCGPGNNGGDGLVAARRLASDGHRVVVALVGPGTRPTATGAARNWDRLASLPVERMHAPTARDVRILMSGVERAAIVIDALLGTGSSGALREPIRTCVELAVAAGETGVPTLSVDTPTVVDLTSGIPSSPVIRADVTVTFHRPKEGLRSRRGRPLAGQVLVAPIGIPVEADRQ